MIATVGSNPLPVALMALHCKVEEIYLIYTEKVLVTSERLTSFFASRSIECKKFPISEDQNLSRLVEEIKGHRLPQGAILNYTAGTKHMSVAVYQAWKEANPTVGKAAYLSGEQVIWDAAAPETLQGDMSLDEILRLHFDEAPQSKRDENETRWAKAIQNYISTEGWSAYKALLPPIYGQKVLTPELKIEEHVFKDVFLNTYNADAVENFKPDRGFASFSTVQWLEKVGSGLESSQEPPQFPTNPGKLKKRYRLLYSEWLELWLADYLASLKIFDEIRQGVYFRKGEQNDSEIDVLASKGHRLFLFSCTTDESHGLIKSKAFEAYQRSRRLGGDQASYAVFSFAKNEDLSKLIDTVEDERWEGSGLFRAFGYEHLIGRRGPCKKATEDDFTLEEALRDWLR
jgi:hypothetical protein